MGEYWSKNQEVKKFQQAWVEPAKGNVTRIKQCCAAICIPMTNLNLKSTRPRPSSIEYISQCSHMVQRLLFTTNPTFAFSFVHISHDVAPKIHYQTSTHMQRTETACHVACAESLKRVRTIFSSNETLIRIFLKRTYLFLDMSNMSRVKYTHIHAAEYACL